MTNQQLLSREPTRHPLPPHLIHDLRSPLTQIIGFSEMLAEQAREGVTAGFVPDLEKVRAAGHHMLGLIEGNFTPIGESASETEIELVGGHRTGMEDLSRNTTGSLLVVDDNEGNREVLSRRLEKLGYTVAEAVDGRQALELLAASPYELVLLDIMMPELDGYEVLRQVKADAATRHIPVIMISALSDMDSVAKCIEMGAEDYLPKPFNPTLLKARVGACLEKKRARDREIQLYKELQENFGRLQQLERLRDDLTQMIIHDLRTPLTAMTAAMQTLDVVGEVNFDQREIVNIAISGAESLLSTIDRLLDVEKLESGSMELDLSLISLPEMIESATSQVAPLAKAKNLKFGSEIAPDLPWVMGDEGKLQRILVNLLGNAIKFTSPGGSVTFRVRSDSEARAVEFFVRDTGEGIPAESHGRIFEKFGQVSPRRGGRQASIGLGLTFCKLAVEAHGGLIKVDSAVGKGSTFSFSIPLQPPAGSAVDPTKARARDCSHLGVDVL